MDILTYIWKGQKTIMDKTNELTPRFEDLHEIRLETLTKIIKEIEEDTALSSKALDMAFSQTPADDSTSVFTVSINTGSRYVMIIDADTVSMSARTRIDGEFLLIDKVYVDDGLDEVSYVKDLLDAIESGYGEGKIKIAMTLKNGSIEKRDEFEKVCKELGYTVEGEFASKE